MGMMSEDRHTGLDGERGAGRRHAIDERPAASAPADLREVVATVAAELEAAQHQDGHWCFELEADATIPAEYVLLGHFLGEIDQAVDDKIAVYLRRRQADHGGWPLYEGGDFNISASVKAYYALKLIGDDSDAPHMRRAKKAHPRPWRGGALQRLHPHHARFVRPGAVARRAGYAGRDHAAAALVSVPHGQGVLLVADRDRPSPDRHGEEAARAEPAPRRYRRAVHHAARARRANYNVNPTGSAWGNLFLGLDKVLQRVEPFFPADLARHGRSRAALAFIRERLNGEEGLGGIFPAMANAVIALELMGRDKTHPEVVTAKRALKRLLVIEEDHAYCQPCLSPVWDTALAAHAMLEVVGPRRRASRQGAPSTGWSSVRSPTRPGTGRSTRPPGTPPGGWAFEYHNDHYPDVDDTAAVVCAMHRADPERYRTAIDRAIAWILGMQSANGGWGAFDVDNTHYYLNSIPFADHGALLDPPTADVTARCLSALAETGHGRDHPAVARAIDFLKQEQEEDGSWFGRWGTNYVYGTWSVLAALNAAGEDMDAGYVGRAVDWLMARQHDDGGWGESCGSYWKERAEEPVASLPSQTAWALLALMAAGRAESASVRRGIDYLSSAERQGGMWRERLYNAVGFPKVFYLHYHGYRSYFPLWAVARYVNLMSPKRPARRLRDVKPA